MPNAPRRARFQIHLSTAIVLMFTAGLLILANVVPSLSTTHVTFPVGSMGAEFTYVNYGWPLEAIKVVFDCNCDDPALSQAQTAEVIKEIRRPAIISYGLLGINILVGIIILLIVWFLCERWVRYRTSRKED